jgi:hypothetical protein
MVVLVDPQLHSSHQALVASGKWVEMAVPVWSSFNILHNL